MTARPVAPVIPVTGRGRPRHRKPGSGGPMPLASPPGRPDVVYGFGRIDASGRVADRATIAALGWRGGDRLTVTAEAGVMLARRDPGGMVTVPARPYIVYPAALRGDGSYHRGGRRGRWPRHQLGAQLYSFRMVPPLRLDISGSILERYCDTRAP